MESGVVVEGGVVGGVEMVKGGGSEVGENDEVGAGVGTDNTGTEGGCKGESIRGVTKNKTQYKRSFEKEIGSKI